MQVNLGVDNRLSKVIDTCVQLHQVLADFEKVVLKENDAIGRSDLKELEDITDEKLIFGDRVKKQIRALKEAMDFLAFELGSTEHEADDDRQLAEFVANIRPRLVARNPELEPKMKQMEDWVRKLKDLRLAIFAKLETNAYLVKRLLEYHRETYAFWQEVARESEATYGQTGKTKVGGPAQKSLLTVRT